jgi:XTP/dITP diphosphohydrolase
VVRRLGPGRLVVATHNKGKVAELNELLRGFGLALESAGDLGLPEPAETGTSFTENALIKAHAAALASGLPALADDSGLVVPALDGAPGIHSRDWAGARQDFRAAMERVWRSLPQRGARDAYFVSVLAIAWPDGYALTFEGRADGSLIWPPRGTGGFGYDPMFVPEGETMSYGELGRAGKHGVSHRARAFAKFRAACLESEHDRST